MTAHLVLPLSTLYYDHLAFAQERLLPFADELEVRNFNYGDIPLGYGLRYHADFGLIGEAFERFAADRDFWSSLQEHGVCVYSLDFGPAACRNLSVFPVCTGLSRPQILDLSLRRMETVRANFSGEVLLENLPYYRTGLFEHVCEPEFLTFALEKLDAGLLIDLAHAEVSACNLGLSFIDYLDALPLERVGQIHISKVFINEFITVDAHECPNDREFGIVMEVLQRIPNKDVGVTIEYYQDPMLLEKAYQVLAQMLKRSKVT
jgi:hypothetical protein